MPATRTEVGDSVASQLGHGTAIAARSASFLISNRTSINGIADAAHRRFAGEVSVHSGSYLDVNNRRRREWAPAFGATRLVAAADLRPKQTYASFALDAGISIFELSRFMGCGVRVIDRS